MNDINLKKENIIRISGSDPKKCMRCGKCTASCPSFAKMEYRPHNFVHMIETGRLDRLLSSESAFYCLTCFACVERCPRLVEPARLIEAVRLTLEREQGGNRMLPDDVPAVLDSETPQQLLVSAYRKYTK